MVPRRPYAGLNPHPEARKIHLIIVLARLVSCVEGACSVAEPELRPFQAFYAGNYWAWISDTGH